MRDEGWLGGWVVGWKRETRTIGDRRYAICEVVDAMRFGV